MNFKNPRIINTVIIFLAAAVLAALMFAGKTPLDSDPIWSSAVGQWIYNNHTVPQFEPFSWTVAGEPWIGHEWLFCLTAYLMRTYFGDLGFLYLTTFSLLLLAGMLALWVNKLNPSRAAGIFCAIGLLMITHYISPRSFVTTYFLFLFLLYLLHFHPRDRYLFWIPFIMVFWVNIHSTAIYGIGMLMTESLYRTMAKKEEARRFWIITAFSTLATLVNPYGYRIWVYIAQFSFNPVNRLILEWKSPDFGAYQLLGLYLIMLATALLFLIRFVQKGLKYEDSDIMYTFWFFAFFAYSLTSARGGAYAILFWIIMSLHYLKVLYEWDLPIIFQTAFLLILLIAVPAVFPKKPITVYNPEKWPLAAIEYLQEHQEYQDHLFNQYEYGGFLIDKGIKPFVDARADVYIQHGVMQDAAGLSRLSQSPAQAFEKYKIKNLIIGVNTPLDYYMQGKPGWKEVFRDSVAVIYKAE